MAEEKPQTDKFKEFARDLECADDKHFGERMKKLMKHRAMGKAE